MWNRRRDKLIEELQDINSDVLCLQEVSEKALRETYVPGLKHVGLGIVYFYRLHAPNVSRIVLL